MTRTFTGIILLLTGILVFAALPEASSAQTESVQDTVTVDTDSVKKTVSPRGAMLRSLVVPGWGQWHNGKKFKSAIMVCAEAACIAGYMYEDGRVKDALNDTEREFYSDERRKYVWWLGGAIIYSMLDAYVDAFLDDFDAQMSIRTENNSTAVELKIEFSPERIFQRRK